MIKVEIELEVIEEIFHESFARRDVFPCSTLILELKESVQSFISEMLSAGKAVSLRTAVKSCLSDLLCEDTIVEDQFFSSEFSV